MTVRGPGLGTKVGTGILRKLARHFAGVIQLTHGTQRDVNREFYTGCVVKNIAAR